ncbi:beta-N-acetylglucosaminidase [Mesotoga prima MesG1.Ag.4.2]|uniref:Beta-N-acetylglucosaminidase n=1 Tax=Mesotoga prima MesG1.Ag.4.2 TaxID=660470 RepID=I2F447_9BACT|nr:protein O-GlcNAcase [Mesotoga prima]AFK06700.1 beta-N-acetylglucosaminidase [Mesotoga prima MesG1.Ag.4.2]
MAFEIRGVVEGFYGKPWTMDIRREVIQYLGDHGFNTYIYAPKDDELHRKRWREQYDENFFKEFSILVQEAESRGISIVFAVSPGLNITYSSNSDVSAMVEKLMRLADAGVRSFGLFYDDIPETLIYEKDRNTFSSLSSAQAYFTNSVFKSINEKLKTLSRFMICPTQYCGREATEYMKTLGTELDRNISILWTGPDVCSNVLSADNAELAENAFQRKILLWDNYPVNDASMVPELHVGPYEGRDPNIVNHAEGIVLNPMIQPLASKIAIFSASEFLLDPYRYDSDLSWRRAISEIAPGCEEEMIHFCEYNLRSPVHTTHSERLTGLTSNLSKLLSKNRWTEVYEILLDEATKISGSEKALNERLSADLIREIEPWIFEFSLWGDALTKTTGILAMRDLMFSSSVSYEELSETTKLCREIEISLCKLVKTETLTSGILFREIVQEILVRTKGYLKLIID